MWYQFLFLSLSEPSRNSHTTSYAHTGWFSAGCFNNKPSCHFLLQLHLDPKAMEPHTPSQDCCKHPACFSQVASTSLATGHEQCPKESQLCGFRKTLVLPRPELGWPRGGVHARRTVHCPTLFRVLQPDWGMEKDSQAAVLQGWREAGSLSRSLRFPHLFQGRPFRPLQHRLSFCHFPGRDRNGSKRVSLSIGL